MDLDDQLRRYFGSSDLAALTNSGLTAGLERMAVDFGLENDRNRRFALWTMMHMLGTAPDLDVAFADAADRDARHGFLFEQLHPQPGIVVQAHRSQHRLYASLGLLRVVHAIAYCFHFRQHPVGLYFPQARFKQGGRLCRGVDRCAMDSQVTMARPQRAQRVP